MTAAGVGRSARPGVVTWGGLAVVAGAAAVLSFATVRDLALASGYPPRLAWLLPVVIDATAVVGSRIWLGGGGQPAALRYARTLALAAAVVTIAANVLQHGLAAYHLAPPWWLVAALAAIPPTALVAVAHQVALLTRPAPPEVVPAEPLISEDCPTADGQDDGRQPEMDLVGRARQLLTTSSVPVGRRRLARELAITEHQARQLLSTVPDLTSTTRTPTRTTSLNGAHHV